MASLESLAAFSGAVDLSQLAKSKPAPSVTGAGVGNAQAGNTNMVAGPWSRIVTEHNIQEVLETSLQVPFVLACHSAKSDNSQTLVGIFQELATQFAGKIGFGFVDIEQQSQLAAALGVSALPTTLAIVQGQILPLFQGLPAVNDIATVLAQLVKEAAQLGLTGVLDGSTESEKPVEVALSPLHEQALSLVEAGDLAGALEAFTKARKEDPKNLDILSALRQVEMMLRLAQVNPETSAEVANKLLQEANAAGLMAISMQLVAADCEMVFGRPDAALARLIDVVKVTSGEEREEVRKRVLQLFEALGPNSTLVSQARKALTNALF